MSSRHASHQRVSRLQLGETVEQMLNWAGATVAGIGSPKATDYRTWSRSQVDEKLYDDIVR